MQVQAQLLVTFLSRNDEGQQLFTRRGVMGDHQGIVHAAPGAQGVFDFAQLDAKPRSLT